MRSAPLLDDDVLAPLLGVSPEQLMGRTYDPLEGVMLALALAFNDLKGAMVAHRIAVHHAERLDQSRPSPGLGQAKGFAVQMARVGISILNEVVALLRKHKKVIDAEPFQQLVAKLDPTEREAWESLLAAAEGRDGEVFRVLVQVRNSVGYHYDDPKRLSAGYRAHFFDDPKSFANEHALLSGGKDMEATRFYFADAAASRAMSLASEKLEEIAAKVGEGANYALWGLVREYLVDRNPDPSFWRREPPRSPAGQEKRKKQSNEEAQRKARNERKRLKNAKKHGKNKRRK